VAVIVYKNWGHGALMTMWDQETWETEVTQWGAGEKSR